MVIFPDSVSGLGMARGACGAVFAALAVVVEAAGQIAGIETKAAAVSAIIMLFFIEGVLYIHAIFRLSLREYCQDRIGSLPARKDAHFGARRGQSRPGLATIPVWPAS